MFDITIRSPKGPRLAQDITRDEPSHIHVPRPSRLLHRAAAATRPDQPELAHAPLAELTSGDLPEIEHAAAA